MATQNLDQLEVRITSNTESATKGLHKLKKNLQSVAGALSSLGSQSSGLNKFASGVTQLSTAMTGMKDSGVGTADFTRLVKNLGQLAGVDSAGIDATARSLDRMGQAMGNVNLLSENASKVTEFTQAMSQLGRKGVSQAIENLPRLTDAFRDLLLTLNETPEIRKDVLEMTLYLAEFVKGAKGYVNGQKAMGESNKEAIATFNRINDALGKFSASVVKVFKTIAKTPFKAFGASVKALANGLTTAVSKLRDFGNRADKASVSTSKFAVAIGTLYVKFWLLVRVLSKFWSAVKSSFDYLETVNYFESSFGAIADKAVGAMSEAGEDSAEAYYKSFTKSATKLTAKMTGFMIDNGNMSMVSGANLGLDPNTTLNYQATFAQIASSMGVASDKAVILSNVLTEIGADLASVKNMEFADVWQDMSSAMVGMSRAVDKYGVNIRTAAMNEKLAQLGIEKTVKDLSQADRAMLRTIMILDASKYAWADLAETLDSPANQIRMLTANLHKLAMMFGSIFLPVLKAVLPYINAVVIALQRLMQTIANLLHIDLSGMVGKGGGSNDALSDILDETEGLGEGLDEASDNAKKLKNNLLGIDELNILNDNSDSIDVGDLEAESLLDQAFIDAVSEYQQAWDDAFAKLENKAQEIADKIVEWAKKVWKPIGEAWDAVGDYVIDRFKYMAGELGKLFKSIASDWAEVWAQDNTEKIFENIFKSVGNVFEMVGNLARQFRLAWDESDKGKRILEAVRDIILKITEHVEKMTKSWANWAGNLDFNPILQSLLNLLEAIRGKADAMLNIIDDFQEIFVQPTLKYFVETLLPGLLDVMTKLVNGIRWDDLRSAFSILFDGMATMAQVLGGGLLTLLDKFADVIIDFVNGGWIKSFALDFEHLANALKNAKDVNDVIDAIFDFGEGRVIDTAKLLNKITQAFNEAFEKIDFKNLGKRVGEIVNKIFDSVDWKSLGKAVSNIATGFLEVISNALQKINWFKVGQAIGDFLAGIDWGKIIWNVLKAIGNVIGGIFSAWLGSLSKAPFETAIATFIGAIFAGNGLSKLLTGKGLLGNLIGSMFGKVDGLGKENGLFESIFGTATKAAGAKGEFAIANGKVADSVSKSNSLLPMELDFFGQIGTKLGGVLKVLGGVAAIAGGATLAGAEFAKQWSDGVTLVNSLLMGLGVALAAVGAVILGVPATVAAAVAGAVFVIGEGILLIHEHWDEIKAWWNGTVVPGVTEFFNGLGEKFKGFADGIAQKWEELKTVLAEKWATLKENFSTFIAEWGEKITEWASARWDEIINKIEEVRQYIYDKWQEFKENFIEHIANWHEQIDRWANEKWDAITNKLEEVRAFIQTKWEEMQANFLDHIAVWHERIELWATEKWQAIKDKLVEIRDFIQDRWHDMQDHFAEHIKVWREDIHDWATSRWEEITEKMDEIKQAIWERWEQMKSDFDEFRDAWREKIILWAQEKWDEVLDAMRQLRDDIIARWNEFKADFDEFLGEWWDRIAQWASEKWDSVLASFDQLKSGIKDAWNKIHEDASSFWSSFKSDLGNWAKGAAESITSAFSNIKSKLSETWSSIKSSASSAFDSVKSTASSAVSSISSTVTSAKNSISSAVSNLTSSVSSMFGSSSSKSSSSSFLQTVSASSTSNSASSLLKKLGFATGGFPEDGLFFANSGELVGKFANNKTAVANNQQITDGIAQATYQAMVRANAESNGNEEDLLRELISAVRQGSKVVIDGREIVSAYDTRKARNGYAFS